MSPIFTMLIFLIKIGVLLLLGLLELSIVSVLLMAFFQDRLAFLADPALFTCLLFALHKVLDVFIIRHQFIPEIVLWRVQLEFTRKLLDLERNNELPFGCCVIKTSAMHPEGIGSSLVCTLVCNPGMGQALDAVFTAIWGTATGRGVRYGTERTFVRAADYLNIEPPPQHAHPA